MGVLCRSVVQLVLASEWFEATWMKIFIRLEVRKSDRYKKEGIVYCKQYQR